MITLYVNEQNITLNKDKKLVSTISSVIASDSINFVEFKFSFDTSWSGYNKTVQFTQQTNTYSVNIGVDGTTCYLPKEITDGLCAISVFGNKDDKRATTIPYQVRIKRSGFMEDSIIPSDTPLNVIEQLIQDVSKLKSDVDNLKTDVNNLK